MVFAVAILIHYRFSNNLQSTLQRTPVDRSIKRWTDSLIERHVPKQWSDEAS